VAHCERCGERVTGVMAIQCDDCNTVYCHHHFPDHDCDPTETDATADDETTPYDVPGTPRQYALAFVGEEILLTLVASLCVFVSLRIGGELGSGATVAGLVLSLAFWGGVTVFLLFIDTPETPVLVLTEFLVTAIAALGVVVSVRIGTVGSIATVAPVVSIGVLWVALTALLAVLNYTLITSARLERQHREQILGNRDDGNSEDET
jgi:hypothetical protein